MVVLGSLGPFRLHFHFQKSLLLMIRPMRRLGRKQFLVLRPDQLDCFRRQIDFDLDQVALPDFDQLVLLYEQWWMLLFGEVFLFNPLKSWAHNLR